MMRAGLLLLALAGCAASYPAAKPEIIRQETAPAEVESVPPAPEIATRPPGEQKRLQHAIDDAKTRLHEIDDLRSK